MKRNLSPGPPANNYNIQLLCWILLFGLISCKKTVDENADNTIPANLLDTTSLGQYLVLDQASKITGTLPASPSNMIRVNSKDTIYLLEDFASGARIEVNHYGKFEIAGFYIGVASQSYYFDIPVVKEESQDSTAVVYINFDDKGLESRQSPFNVPILIQPHGPDGKPLKTFVRILTIEKPQTINSAKLPMDIVSPAGASPPPFIWKWLYTEGHYSTGVLKEAPDLWLGNVQTTGGCCNDDGTSSTVANDPYCFEKFSDGTKNPRWRSIEVSPGIATSFDILEFYNDGTFRHESKNLTKIYRPSYTDFCSGTTLYHYQPGNYLKYGKHDFKPGNEVLRVSYDATDPPVYGETISSGRMAYSNHLLALEAFGAVKVYGKALYIHDKYRKWWD
ncbi:hypothetical protein [Agriterribacter sp.]|mgnify:CR=1 FL=1|uniref:hypothetical protein n=1 Tax=Agriterribacter sp. TaxID=2821509 RepID=UPI002C006732|nr:hypothetical protein [Agriterribacter sp.]HRP56280.1 hypothetical protein [Agriterribacter sp.]